MSHTIVRSRRGTPSRPGRIRRLFASVREPLTVACSGVLLATALISLVYGCSSESEPHPPPGGGDCTGHCGLVNGSGGSTVSNGMVGNDNGDAGEGTFADVNPPAFDGNLAPM
jgi:hypothetical protein